jgi:gluconate 2-dehydrogenase gamma chain
MKQPMDNYRLSRRKFIQITSLSTGALLLPSCYTTKEKINYKVLTPNEANILDAIADQIIPPDDFAGGKDAGVTNYIDRQLEGFFSDLTGMYKKCLRAFNNTCKKVYDKEFVELSFDQQFDLLKDMQVGKYNNEDWEGYTASSFFSTVRGHCMQGYYGSPIHGGNKDYVSYRLIGLDSPLIIGRNHY